jgi:predicted negative regulator of RcsB-dependent stress response
MSDWQNEDEQAEAIKRWWRENGRAVITGLVVGLALVLGWKSWVDYQERQLEQASHDYEQIQVSLSQKQWDSVQKQTELLTQNHADTPYASLALLGLAKAHVEQQQWDKAATNLRAVMNNEAALLELRQIARLRLARLSIHAKQYDTALALLSPEQEAKGFAALYAELKGDIHRAKGERDLARSAYQKALLLEGGERAVVQLKLDDLGGQGT